MSLTPALTYFDWIRFHAKRRPDAMAFREAETGLGRSYAALDHRVDALASVLRDRYRIAPGDRVMLLSRTVIEAFELQFACARLGAIFVPVNWRLSVAELLAIADNAGPALLVHQAEFGAAAQTLASHRGAPRLVIQSHVPGEGYEEAVAGYQGGPVETVAVDWDQTWIILYTSGTTGLPKGAMLSYRMMYFNAVNFRQASHLGAETVVLCCMPIFHTGGLNCYANPVLFAGGTVVTMADFDAGLALKTMQDPQVRLTHLFAVPAIYLMISSHPAFATASFPSLKVVGLGGAPATDTLLRTWLSKGVPLQPAFGMTEIGPAITVMDIGRVQEKLGSAGQPVMNVECRIVDINNCLVDPDIVGELQVRGPIVMSGYWGAPELTAQAFVDDWFKTGDAGRIDSDGFLYIVDRYKDMYISGGENIYPTEVENALARHPSVERSSVIGVSDPKWGEVGHAFIVCKPGAVATEEDIVAHLLLHLAKFKVPKHFSFMGALPQTASGKVKKQDLRRVAATS